MIGVVPQSLIADYCFRKGKLIRGNQGCTDITPF